MIRYLTEKEVILISSNSLMIRKYSPEEQIGVKDPSLLNSAIHRLKQSAFRKEAYPTIWLKAAALYASLCQNHPFHNANKRTGFAAMKQFLWLNGYSLLVSEEEKESIHLNLAQRKRVDYFC